MSPSTNNIHKFIFDSVQSSLVESVSEETVYRHMFENFRYVNHEPYGLRLTHAGNALMSKYFEKYQFENATRVNHHALVVLDQNMLWPYYVGHKYVAFYLQADAAWYTLTGCDLNQYVKMI